MELNHLRYFRQVALSENISQAAKALYITQPALSVTIKRLETELGYPLFLRKGNKIQLTDAGRCFLTYVNSIFSLLEEGTKKARELANQTDSVLRIASGFGIVRDMTAAYLQAHPTIRVEVHCMPNNVILDHLNYGRADAGFLLGRANDSRLEERVVMTGRFCVCVNREHPFAQREVVRMADLEGQLLFCSNIAQTHEILTRIFDRAHVTANLLTLDEKDVLFSAAEKGLGGVVCMPMMAVDRFDGMTERGLVFVPIADCYEPQQVVMLRPRGAYYTEEQEQYLRYLEQCFASNEEMLTAELHRRGVL